MEAILIGNGKFITPSYTNFLVDYGNESDYDGVFDAERDWNSRSFYYRPLEERLDIFEIYLEYFFRQIYYSCMSGDEKLGPPQVTEKGCTFEISSCIENSGYRFVLMLDLTCIRTGVRGIQLAIADDISEYVGLRAAIGFPSLEIHRNKQLEIELKDRIRKVCKSIVTLNPEMATWYLLQGINIIDDAFFEEKGGNAK